MSTGAILFTDMVGSTELRSRLGDDRADVLRAHHDRLLARVVEAHHGTVLRWTGDGIKAAFSTASDAVAAAVDMQRAVREYAGSTHAVAAFDVRIGLGAGEVTVADDDHHGVCVIEAARLEALARPGEILATDVVRALGHRRANVSFEAVGERVLKGLDLPVMVHRVIDLSAQGIPPIPRALAADRRLPMVGRSRDVDRFTAAWNETRTGSAGLLLVSGAPGLGKTRLVSQQAELAHAEGAIVLVGACGSDLELPYEPFAVALREVVAFDDSIAAAITDGRGPLARLFPGHTTSDAELPARARLELFDAVVELVERLSRLHPVLLVLDDLHWATAPTLLLLRHLVSEAADARVLVVGTYRDEELGPAHPLRELLASVRSSPRATRIELAALTEADIAEMVAVAAGDAAAGAHSPRVAEIAHLVHRDSSGSPFFASELLHHLAVTGELATALKEGASGALPIPDSVHDVVAQRLVRLPDGAHTILAAAAIIGPTFELDLLADVVDRPADEVLDLLDEAARSGLVLEVGIDQFAFAHAIVRTALIDDMSATRRARVHRRVAEALEALGAEQFDELARHWRLAGMPTRSTTYLARSARRDMMALAYESARTRYQEVVDLLATDPQADVTERAKAWLGLGSAGRALADPAYTSAISRAARLARSARDAGLMAEAAALTTWPGTFFHIAEEPDLELVELCEDALTLIAPTDPGRVPVLATLASHLTFASTATRRQELIAEALELAELHDDAGLVARALNAEFLCLWDPSTLERREQIARDLGRIGRATGEPEIEFLSGFMAAYCEAERGELATARTRLVDLSPTIEMNRNPYFAFLAERLMLSIDIIRGVPGCQQRVDDLLDRFGATHADTDGTWALQTGGLAYQTGTMHHMLNTIQAMTAGNLGRTWTSAQAIALLWADRRDEAEAILDEYGEIPRNYFWLPVVQVRAEVATELGRLDHCRAMFDELAPLRGLMGIIASGSLCFGLVSRTLGSLALALDDLPVALDHLTEAVAQADRMGAPFESVISRRLLATAMLAFGEAARAADLIDEATVIGTDHGFMRELEHLAALSLHVR